MVRLEDIAVGALVTGLASTAPVTIIAVKWRGAGALEVSFKEANGVLGNQLLFRSDEERVEVVEGYLPWSFDADADSLRLVSEAYRIHLAHLFDPYLAVHTSEIEPLPHQISAVYQEMLSRLPLRYILADDPGAGKTIMTGLFLKELLIRGDLHRCLIVTPGSLAEQWEDELLRKFGLRFEILISDRIETVLNGNLLDRACLCIARLDKLSRDEQIQEKLRATEWDLIVVDEAHKMSATVWGGENKYTKRFLLGRLLSSITRHFLLLTATPHNGKDTDFQLFMSLIDPDRFEGAARSGPLTVDVSDVMRRLVKEELLKFDGKPLFPERNATTVSYDLSPRESELYAEVTEYVRNQFNLAEKLENGRRKTNVGFALTTLQRRLASSPEAIYLSLQRRRLRLESKLADERLGKCGDDCAASNFDDYDDDDLPASEFEEAESEVLAQASTASSVSEMEAEIAILKNLEDMANIVRMSGEDKKWDELSGLLQDNGEMFDPDGRLKKLIVFSEHRDTLNYLASKIRSLLGRAETVVTIDGSMDHKERRKVEEQFKQDKEVRILVATDAAGEGINLQRAHLMVNYDLPWNPNRLEQRFGRIHRIGQSEVCHLWNLVAKQTREGMVFQRLFEKLEQVREALKGKVYDVLGKVTFDNKPLRELLIEAIRYGDSPEAREKLNKVVDNSLSTEALRNLLEERSLTDDTMDVSRVMAIREEMERIEARRLQPHFIEAFFIEAFTRLGGKIRPREQGRYEICSVPSSIRNQPIRIGLGDPVLESYERICFDKNRRSHPGLPLASLVSPGHPLLEATNSLIRERYADVLKRGAIFIDDGDEGLIPRLLFYIEDSVQDDVDLPHGGKRVISKHIHFVEINEDGSAVNAGYAPYLDYRSANETELASINSYLKSHNWLGPDIDEIAIDYAIAHIIPNHVGEVRQRRSKLIEKTMRAVKERLTAEIQHWDFKASELKTIELAGKTNAKLNSQTAERRAEVIHERMRKRLAELEAEKRISALPPVVVGGALVIPGGLLRRLDPEASTTGTYLVANQDTEAKRAVELAAMKAVMDIEASLGHQPRDVSAMKCGYDVESMIPPELGGDAAPLKFIEVKGRAKGAGTVTVTKNEILTAFNKPEDYILAVVEVDSDQNSTKTVYLKKPFREPPGFAVTSVTFNIAELVDGAEIALSRG
jgi:superfamily II DNA or RNA helicase